MKPGELIAEQGELEINAGKAVIKLSMAAGVVPQSSCNFKPMAPASICSSNAAGKLALPLPKNPKFIGKLSAASNIR